MISTEAQRTLVKSPPELWAELSDADSLARHLCDFGEIRIVGVEPESTIAWEAEGVSGAVQLKASGWGTRVTLTAVREPPAPPEPVAEPEPQATIEPEPTIEPTPQPAPLQPRFFARLFRRRRKVEAAPTPELEAQEQEQEPAPEPESKQEQEQEQPDLGAELKALEESTAAETTAVLTGVLDRLGAAHHRPFSRA